MADRFPCPCCGYLTLGQQGWWEICPVCHWDDDPAYTSDPTYWPGGANPISLEEARENFREFGAALREDIRRVRQPLPDEIPPA